MNKIKRKEISYENFVNGCLSPQTPLFTISTIADIFGKHDHAIYKYVSRFRDKNIKVCYYMLGSTKNKPMQYIFCTEDIGLWIYRSTKRGHPLPEDEGNYFPDNIDYGKIGMDALNKHPEKLKEFFNRL